MKLLRVIATLDPRHGGPAAGLRAITPALSDLGHETAFASLDAPGTPSPIPGAPLHALGPARGGYAYSPRLLPWLRAHAAEYDAVFVHGLWQYHGRAVHAALRGRATPYVVFPHGMLDPWFQRAYPLKHLKKWVYWQLNERRVLRDAAAVFFTCEEERRLARVSFRPYACRERVVAYGTATPPADGGAQLRAWRTALPALGDRPFWLFLGRIHEKKGVDLLVRAYGEWAGRAGSSPVPALVLAGPCADARYRGLLDDLASRLPRTAALHWAGMLEGEPKWGALRAAEAFVLPSHQENFGIAVAEALAVGTPVLISRQVNIWTEIEGAGAGIAEPDTAAGTRRLLERWAATPAPARAAMRLAARELFAGRYEIGRVARSLSAALAPLVPPAALPAIAAP
jgi:glycosyltransferase involved in cell wall biosynthesis